MILTSETKGFIIGETVENIIYRPKRHGKATDMKDFDYPAAYAQALEVIEDQVHQIVVLEKALRDLITPASSTGHYIDWTVGEKRGVPYYMCTYCGKEWEVFTEESHAEDCPVEIARRLLDE